MKMFLTALKEKESRVRVRKKMRPRPTSCRERVVRGPGLRPKGGCGAALLQKGEKGATGARGGKEEEALLFDAKGGENGLLFAGKKRKKKQAGHVVPTAKSGRTPPYEAVRGEKKKRPHLFYPLRGEKKMRTVRVAMIQGRRESQTTSCSPPDP